MKLIRNTLLCATMLMGVGTTTAFAQDAAPESDATADNDGGEIVVTATRRATTLQDAPINISAISTQELAKQRIDDVKGLAAFTPGLSVAETGPRTTGTIVMRGISSSDAGAGANSNSAVGVYLGEVPLYLDFKLLDIARVEVLQGPQGTLYGLGTLAGAIRYMPNRPNTDKWSIDAHLRAFGQSQSGQPGVNGDVTVNIPILQDHIAFRSTVGYYDNPGFIDYNYLLRTPGVSDPQPVRGPTAAQGSLGSQAQRDANFYSAKDLNYERTFTTRNQLLLELNPGAKLYLTYAHQETRTGGTQSVQAGVLGTGPYESSKRYREPGKRIADLFAAEANVSLGFAQVVATAAWTKLQTETSSDQTDFLLDAGYGYEAFPNFSAYTQSKGSTRQFNGEIRIVSSHGGPFSWVLGGFYNNQRVNSNGMEVTPGYVNWYNLNRAGTLTSSGAVRQPINRPDDIEYISFVNTQVKEKAVYGEGTFQVTDKWQVTGGIRYFKYNAFVSGGTDTPFTGSGQIRTPYPLVQFAPGQIATGSTAASGIVWKANTSYKFSDDLLAYFTYSTGYRTGSVNRVAPCILPLPDPPVQSVCALSNELSYQPDKTRNIELGVRASLFDKRLQFTAAGFHIAWSGLQLPSRTVNGGVGITVNANDAVSQGFEFTTRFKITPRLTFQGTYSYTDAHLTGRAVGAIASGKTKYDIEAGDRLPGSSKHAASAQLTYTQPLDNGAEIEANWAVTYKGDVYSRVGLRAFGEVIPAYTTHRASVTYHAEHFDLGIYADNIFNKYAVTGINADLRSYNAVRNNFVERYYGQTILTPRRVGVDFRFHY